MAKGKGSPNFTSGGGSGVLGAVPTLPAQRRSVALGGGGRMKTGRKDAIKTHFARAVHKGMKGK